MRKRNFIAAGCLLAAFVLWTILVCRVDVRPVGPQESAVGFACLNSFVHKLTGVHMILYIITDWLGLVPLAAAMGFALLGLNQWIRRKYIWKVDSDILVLGGFYLAVIAAYVFFEMHAVNYRPVLIEGRMEASYPSSTTMLVLCVMPTALLQFNARIRKCRLRHCVSVMCVGFMVFMVAARLLSGVHWFSDIVGGILLSSGLVLLYRAVSKL